MSFIIRDRNNIFIIITIIIVIIIIIIWLLVSGCKTALKELSYNWRHDSVLANLMQELKNSTNKQLVLYADIADYNSPAIITGSSQRPDIVIVNVNKLYVFELTVRFETRITINAGKKKRNYEQLCRQLRNNYDEVKYFNHCIKSIRIRSYSGPYFPAFGLNTERYSV